MSLWLTLVLLAQIDKLWGTAARRGAWFTYIADINILPLPRSSAGKTVVTTKQAVRPCGAPSTAFGAAKRKAAATFVAAAFCSISAYAPFATLRRKQPKTFFAPLHKSRDGSLCGTVFRHIPLRPFVMQKVYPQGFVCGFESPQGAYYIQVQKSVFRQEHACTSIPVCYHTNFQHNERREIQNAIVMGFPLCCA